LALDDSSVIRVGKRHSNTMAESFFVEPKNVFVCFQHFPDPYATFGAVFDCNGMP